MIKAKNVAFAGVVLAAGVLSPSLIAQPTLTGTVSLDQGSYSYYVGGEFTAITDPSLLAPYLAVAGTPTVQTGKGAASSGVAGTGLGFQTFCVQTSVDFSPASAGYNNTTPYNYSTSLASIDYVNGVAQKNNAVNPLTVGAAWLYGEFAQGKLAGYDFANTGLGTSTSLTTTTAGLSATRQTDAGLLQAALWALEGNQTYSGYNVASTANNIFYTEALNEFGGSLSAADTAVSAGTYSDYDVEVLNLYTGTGTTLNSTWNSDQNQLVWLGGGTGYGNQKAPDGAMTLSLLGASLASLAAFARKSRGLVAGQRSV